MTLQTVLILIGTGVIGGLMASLVGGASVITFPALLALGLPPVVATASNLVAVSAGNFLAAVTDRAKLPPFNRAAAQAWWGDSSPKDKEETAANAPPSAAAASR